MRAKGPRRWGAGLVLAFALLTAGCAPLRPPPGRGALSYMPRGEPSHVLASPPLSTQEPEQPEQPQRLHRRHEFREQLTAVGPGSEAPAVGGAGPRGIAEPEQQSVILTHHAVLKAVDSVWAATAGIASALPQLAARQPGFGGTDGAFTRYSLYGAQQLEWIHGALGATTALSDAALEVGDADMALGLLRLTGPRLQAAMAGAALLAAWLDFLNLADAVLRKCPFYGVERLFMDMERVQRRLEPSMKALASLEPAQVEVAAEALPVLMGELTAEFQSILETARVATERGGQLMAAAQWVEMLTMASMMKLSLPRLPPAAPLTLGLRLTVGSSGVMMGSQVVLSAEWLEMMRRLVQAGVLAAPAVGAAVRIHAGQTMMAQVAQDLPKGVRDALGEGPEVSAMHETGRAGAGMSQPPQHHVLPQEHREWFEKRGFTGDMDIDQFCVEMEQAHHQAIHGGGNWSLGRTWPGEWNQMIMAELVKAETKAGQLLTRNMILKIIAKNMKDYKIPMNFIPWGRQ